MIPPLFRDEDKNLLVNWGIYSRLDPSCPQNLIDDAKDIYTPARIHSIHTGSSLPTQKNLLPTLKLLLRTRNSFSNLVGKYVSPDVEEELAESVARFLLSARWQEISSYP
jgi:hypothetical protein